MFRNELSFGVVSSSYLNMKNNKKSKTILSNILCDIDTCTEFTDLNSLEPLTSIDKIGAPFGVRAVDGYILPDSPRHYYHTYKVKKILG